MPFYTYILYSEAIDQYYIGHTGDLADRSYRHVHSGSRATKKANDWRVVYTKEFQTRSAAIEYELMIKNKKKQEIHHMADQRKRLERPASLREGRRFDSDILHSFKALRKHGPFYALHLQTDILQNNGPVSRVYRSGKKIFLFIPILS